MRSWDKYCEETNKALVHFRDCIAQPVYITGYLEKIRAIYFKWITVFTLIGVVG